jgi:hypothetical protein
MTRKEEYDRQKDKKRAEIEKKFSESWKGRFKEPIIIFTAVLALATAALTSRS